MYRPPPLYSMGPSATPSPSDPPSSRPLAGIPSFHERDLQPHLTTVRAQSLRSYEELEPASPRSDGEGDRGAGGQDGWWPDHQRSSSGMHERMAMGGDYDNTMSDHIAAPVPQPKIGFSSPTSAHLLKPLPSSGPISFEPDLLQPEGFVDAAPLFVAGFLSVDPSTDGLDNIINGAIPSSALGEYTSLTEQIARENPHLREQLSIDLQNSSPNSLEVGVVGNLQEDIDAFCVSDADWDKHPLVSEGVPRGPSIAAENFYGEDTHVSDCNIDISMSSSDAEDDEDMEPCGPILPSELTNSPASLSTCAPASVPTSITARSWYASLYLDAEPLPTTTRYLAPDKMPIPEKSRKHKRVNPLRKRVPRLEEDSSAVFVVGFGGLHVDGVSWKSDSKTGDDLVFYNVQGIVRSCRHRSTATTVNVLPSPKQTEPTESTKGPPFGVPLTRTVSGGLRYIALDYSDEGYFSDSDVTVEEVTEDEDEETERAMALAMHYSMNSRIPAELQGASHDDEGEEDAINQYNYAMATLAATTAYRDDHKPNSCAPPIDAPASAEIEMVRAYGIDFNAGALYLSCFYQGTLPLRRRIIPTTLYETVIQGEPEFRSRTGLDKSGVFVPRVPPKGLDTRSALRKARKSIQGKLAQQIEPKKLRHAPRPVSQDSEPRLHVRSREPPSPVPTRIIARNRRWYRHRSSLPLDITHLVLASSED
ncbi:uncharacterized protein BXZ73DRAFT_100092 [Epithele typhae]|uniref:uncharacterized protein n=1 Tax=Epithele typhae TaxID=378194 RepID=UPI002007AF51|nr:uncharacterized protein BXZ73DRAFT_100092 [Epithele typhae]KAH9937877.1 hypothetical protein BXZ73DRAFT_100092 [Epithele typhae]